eukprot:jgi/Galph1/4248/GphlegSOOS_G2937.1
MSVQHRPWQVNKDIPENLTTFFKVLKEKNRVHLWKRFYRLATKQPEQLWQVYAETDPQAELLLTQALNTNNLLIASIALSCLEALFQFIVEQKENLLSNWGRQVAKVLVSNCLETTEFLLQKGKRWIFEQRTLTQQVARLYYLVFCLDIDCFRHLVNKMTSSNSQILLWLGKTMRGDTYLHDLLHIFMGWSQIAFKTEMEYLYERNSIFVSKLIQNICRSDKKQWISSLLETLLASLKHRFRHASYQKIRKGLSLSAIQAIMKLMFSNDIYSSASSSTKKGEGKWEHIQQQAREILFQCIANPKWLETEQVSTLISRLSLVDTKHLQFLEQVFNVRQQSSCYYIQQSPFHKMNREPTNQWIYSAVALIMAMNNNMSLSSSTYCFDKTKEDSMETFQQICDQIWPMESRASFLERILLFTEHLICPLIGVELLLHIFNRMESMLEDWSHLGDETLVGISKKDIKMEIVCRLPEFQVILALVRRELKQPSQLSAPDRNRIATLVSKYSSHFLLLQLWKEHNENDDSFLLLKGGLLLMAKYRQAFPWVAKEQRMDLSKLFFSSAIRNVEDSLEYHWIEPYLEDSSLLDSLLSNICLEYNNENLKSLIAAQQGPHRLSRMGQLLYIFSICTCRSQLPLIHYSCTYHRLYNCIVQLWKLSGCFSKEEMQDEAMELHFWIYWLSCMMTSNGCFDNQLEEYRIAWFETTVIELWRKPFVIMDIACHSGEKRKEAEKPMFLTTWAVIRRLIAKVDMKNRSLENVTKKWFAVGVAWFIRLQQLSNNWLERVVWWKGHLDELFGKQKITVVCKPLNQDMFLLANNVGDDVLRQVIYFWLRENDNEKETMQKRQVEQEWKHLLQEMTHQPLDDSREWYLPAVIHGELLEGKEMLSEQNNTNQQFIKEVSLTTSHRLIWLQSLLCHWDIYASKSSNTVIEMMGEIVSHVEKEEEVEQLMHCVLNHSGFRTSLSTSRHLFRKFTRRWTGAKWYHVDDRMWLIMKNWCKDYYGLSIVKQWFPCLSCTGLWAFMEYLLNELVQLTKQTEMEKSEERLQRKRIHLIVDNLIKLVEELKKKTCSMNMLSSNITNDIAFGWHWICQWSRGQMKNVIKKSVKAWERLWVSILAADFLVLHSTVEMLTRGDNFDEKQGNDRKKPYKRKWLFGCLEIFYQILLDDQQQEKHSICLNEEQFEAMTKVLQVVIPSKRKENNRTCRWQVLAWYWLQQLFGQRLDKQYLLPQEDYWVHLIGFCTLKTLIKHSSFQELPLSETESLHLLDFLHRLLPISYSELWSASSENHRVIEKMPLEKYFCLVADCLYQLSCRVCNHFQITVKDNKIDISLFSDRNAPISVLSQSVLCDWFENIIKSLTTLQDWNTSEMKRVEQISLKNISALLLQTILQWIPVILFYIVDDGSAFFHHLQLLFQILSKDWKESLQDGSKLWDSLQLPILQFLMAFFLSHESSREITLSWNGYTAEVSVLSIWNLMPKSFSEWFLKWLNDYCSKIASSYDYEDSRFFPQGVFCLLMAWIRYQQEYGNSVWLIDKLTSHHLFCQNAVQVLHRLDGNRVKQTIQYLSHLESFCLSENHTWIIYQLLNFALFQRKKDFHTVVVIERMKTEKIVVYEPDFLIIFLFQLLKHRNDETSLVIDMVRLLVSKHLISFLIACLSHDNESLRWMACTCLEWFLGDHALNHGAHPLWRNYPERKAMTLFLICLKNSIHQYPADGFFIAFCISLWEIIGQPTHPLYMTVTRICLKSLRLSLDASFIDQFISYVDMDRMCADPTSSFVIENSYRRWCLHLLSKMESLRDYRRLQGTAVFDIYGDLYWPTSILMAWKRQ